MLLVGYARDTMNRFCKVTALLVALVAPTAARAKAPESCQGKCEAAYSSCLETCSLKAGKHAAQCKPACTQISDPCKAQCKKQEGGKR